MKNVHSSSSLSAQLLASVTLAALALVSCSPRQEAPPRILKIGNVTEPLTLDPHRATMSPENNIMANMFIGLTTSDSKGNDVPGMAESWTTSPDGLVWTFKLRKAMWSDGVAVTADDFVFGIQRALNPKTGAAFSTYIYQIKNAEAVNNAKMPVEKLGVRAVDLQTVEITLEYPVPYFTSLASHYLMYPVPRRMLEKYGEQWIRPENAISNGPFLLKEWKSNDFIRMEKNSRFYDAGNVCLNEVIYFPTTDAVAAERLVKTGQLDANMSFAGGRLAFLQKEMPDYLRVGPMALLDYIVFNTKKPGYSDMRVRQALSIALDRDFMAKEILRAGETPATSLVPPGVKTYPDGPVSGLFEGTLPERQARARGLLEAAGFGPNKPLAITYSYSRSADRDRLAPIIQDAWQTIAPWVRVELLGTDTQIHYAKIDAGDFEVAQANWNQGNDPKEVLYLLETRSNIMNSGRYSNPVYDRLIIQSDYEQDTEKRWKLLRQAEELAVREAAIAPTYFGAHRALVNPRITGWDDNRFHEHRARYLCTKEALAEAAKK